MGKKILKFGFQKDIHCFDKNKNKGKISPLNLFLFFFNEEDLGS